MAWFFFTVNAGCSLALAEDQIMHVTAGTSRIAATAFSQFCSPPMPEAGATSATFAHIKD